jgi:hypothetical protein
MPLRAEADRLLPNEGKACSFSALEIRDKALQGDVERLIASWRAIVRSHRSLARPVIKGEVTVCALRQLDGVMDPDKGQCAIASRIGGGAINGP